MAQKTTWPIFEGLPDEVVKHVLDEARRRRFSVDEVVFHMDDPADTIHLVDTGRFAAEVVTPFGDTAILSVISSGEIFGELALLGGDARRTATVTALEPSETLSVRKATFDELRASHSEVEGVLNAILAAKINDLTEQLVDALYVPANIRVLRRLADLVDIYSQGEGPVEIPVSQEVLSQLAGTSRATVNKSLRAEEERGLLSLDRKKTTVLDPEAFKKRESEAVRLAGGVFE